ncbi:MAG: hypothetical protein ABR559_03485 [Gemmatimonadota bacterium]
MLPQPGPFVRILAASLLAAACASDPVGTRLPGGASGAVIGPAGGAVGLEGQAELVIPPGALHDPLLVTIEPGEPPAAFVAAGGFGPAYRVTPPDTVLAGAAEIALFLPGAAQSDGPLGDFVLLTTSHPRSLGPQAVIVLPLYRLDPVPGGLLLTARTLHLGPFQAARTPNSF